MGCLERVPAPTPRGGPPRAEAAAPGQPIRWRRSRGSERSLAVCFATVMLGMTVVLMVSVVVPLVQPQYQEWYSVLLGFLGVVALGSGLYVLQIGWGALRWTWRYQREKDTDWQEAWRAARDASAPGAVREWSQVQHFVVVTNYAEPGDMLRLLAYTLMSQRAPGLCRRQITLVLAMEEREGAAGREKARALCDELGPYFRDVLATFHPAGLPGEIRGKASNFKWAAAQVEAYIRQGAGLYEEDCIIHVADADSLYDPNYFANVTYLFCVRDDRHDLVWQPCMIPTCNFWQVAPPCRQVNVMIAAQEMMSAHDPLEFQVPFSTYGVTLAALQHVGGTGSAGDAQDGDVIAEDHHLFIKAFLATGGRMRVQPVFLPCLNFSVGGQQTSLCRNLCDRYVQAKRHMFGISELFYLVALLLQGCCRHRRGFGCRACFRALALCGKLLKVHSVPYAGLWIPLGLVLVSLLKLQQSYCEDREVRHAEALCRDKLGHVTQSRGAVIFSVSTSLTFIGGMFVVAAFARMLYVVHHTLMNIGDPRGEFMNSFLWASAAHGPPSLSFCSSSSWEGLREPPFRQAEQEQQEQQQRPPLRRPVVVGDGYPWCGTVIQLAIEFLTLGLLTSLLFGSIPAVLGLLRFIIRGHTMDYVTAPKGPAAGFPAADGAVRAAPSTPEDLGTSLIALGGGSEAGRPRCGSEEGS
uniref:Glycosyltransferase 2-like domain-containing protein n=1 Tax=Alexandrium monilatum TaxID=311494 RepID=A0A7S4VYC4_9DINO